MNPLKKKVSPQEMKAKLSIALKKLEKREQIVSAKRARSRNDAKEALRQGNERDYRVSSRRYSLIDGQFNAVSNLNEMAMSTIDVLEMQENVNEIIEIGQMLSSYQKSLGIDNQKLQDALTNINVSMEHLAEATEMISTTIDSIAEASPEASGIQDSLRNELLAEIQSEALPAEKEEKTLKSKIEEAQRE